MFSSFSLFSFGAYIKAPVSPNGPGMNDQSLAVEKVNDKPLSIPSSMAFLSKDDILVTEKETGKVMRIVDGHVQEDLVLDVEVANTIERGLLGIAVSKHNDGTVYVFLFYTESGGGKDGDDLADNIDPAGNRLYRYELVDGKLVNPSLLLDLPAVPDNGRGEHNGGKIVIGPDNNVYTVIGEVGGHRTQAQNIRDGPEADGTGGVLRITQDGDIVEDPVFASDPLNLYYAIGIRNSFGIDFDPITGELWDTENGPTAGDEINMVEQGFNSGWYPIQGKVGEDLLGHGSSESDLVEFENSHYRDPEFTWALPIGVTDAKFLNSDKLGKQYENNLFVGDIDNGYIYRFTLNTERNAIELNGSSYNGVSLADLEDKEVNAPREAIPLIFGQGFGGITDLEVGPDGYLYVLSYHGDLFRVKPKSDIPQDDKSLQPSTTTAPLANPTPTSESEDGNPEAPTATGTAAVTARIVGIEGDQSYDPNPIEIEAGQTVTWLNGDAISHTVTSGSGSDSNGDEELFDSKAILAGGSYSKTFDDPGTYDYYCFYHPSMVGEIVVN
jgi:glucose/arabinose dehydrogenase/plastocyanin